MCELGVGCPELGSVSFAELTDIRGALGLPVERDLWFTPAGILGVYADAATAAGGILA